MRALDAAKSAGAEYADVRISSATARRTSSRASAACRASCDNETFGFGVRVLVGGSWGFAATSELTPDEVVARRPAGRRRRRSANRAASVKPVELALRHPPVPNGRWRQPMPRSIRSPSRSRTRSRCCSPPTRPRSRPPARASCNSTMFFLKDEKTFANTEGTVTAADDLSARQPGVTVTAVSADNARLPDAPEHRHPARWASATSTCTEHNLVANARPLGRGGGAEALGQAGRGRALRPHPAPDPPLAHHPRGGRAPHRARPRAWASRPTTPAPASSAPPEKMLGKLKFGSELHEHPRRPLPARLALRLRLGRRGRRSPRTSTSSRTASSSTTRPRASRRCGSTGGTSSAASRSRSHGCSYAQIVGRRAVPAHAQRVAAAGREGPRLGGPHRRDRQRHRDRRRRLVLASTSSATTRSSAASSSTRSRTGKITGMLKDVAYQMRTPRVLGRDGHDRRPKSYDARRRLRRRQGPAGAVQRGEPRLRADAPQADQRDQHREAGMSRAVVHCAERAPTSRAPSARRSPRRSSASPPPTRRRVTINSGDARQHALRREPDLHRRRQLQHHGQRAQRGRQEGRATAGTNRLDDASLQRRWSELRSASRGSSPEDPELMPELGPQQYAGSRNAWSDGTARLEPDARAAAVRDDHRRRACRGTGVHRLSRDPGGRDRRSPTARGCSPTLAAPTSALTTTVRTPDGTGSGWAGRRIQRLVRRSIPRRSARARSTRRSAR